jgi:hypothetical protein
MKDKEKIKYYKERIKQLEDFIIENELTLPAPPDHPPPDDDDDDETPG